MTEENNYRGIKVDQRRKPIVLIIDLMGKPYPPPLVSNTYANEWKIGTLVHSFYRLRSLS